jgi:hypothetical protein
MTTPAPTPETDAFIRDSLLRGNSIPDTATIARKLERERNAAIKMAWELVQELVLKCDDPIHKKQRDQIEELHHAWTV